MKKNHLIILLFSVLVFVGCSSNHEKKDIKNTITTFFECLNSRNFEKMKEISSPKMHIVINQIKTFGDDLVIYKDIEFKDIEIDDNVANVDIVAKDIYGNDVTFKWSMVRIEDKWKMDMFENLNSEIINITDNDRKYSDIPYTPTDEYGNPIIKEKEIDTAIFSN